MWGNLIRWRPAAWARKEVTRQNKGDRSLLNTLQGSSGQDSKGETVCHEAVVRDYSYREE